MKNFKKILFPTDFSAGAEKAAAFAVHFARSFGARLVLAHVSLIYEEPDNRHTDFQAHLLEEPQARFRRLLEEHLANVGGADLEHELVQLHGVQVAASLADYAEQHGIDLIVMGTHGRHGFKRWLLGSVAEELVRRAPCPVFTVKEAWSGRPQDMATILVPVDFSLASRTALHGARLIAKRLGACLQVLHVVQPPAYPEIYAYATDADFFEHARDKSIEILKTLLDEEGPTVESTIHVIAGHPSHEIIKFAEGNGSRMIVMAHLGFSGISERLLGSVTEHVVRSAACPVLTADLGQ